MVTPKELAQVTMTEEKKASAKNNLFAFYIGRPISYVLTIPFLYLKIKPNTISFLSFFPSLVGFLMIGFGTTMRMQLTGAFMFMLWNFMDGIDGNVARYTKQTSTLGTLWDAASGYFAMMLMYFAPGIGVMNVSNVVLNGFMPDYYYIVFSGLTAIFTLLPRQIFLKRTLLMSDISKSELHGKGVRFYLWFIIMNLTSPSGFVNIILVLAVTLGFLPLFVIVYFILYLTMFCYSMAKLLRI